MAAGVTTDAASSVSVSGARLNAHWSVSAVCCGPPCCDVAQRFYYGLTNPPGTLASAGVFCSNTGSDCSGGQSYSKVISGLLRDTTYYFRGNVVISGCGGGTCSGTGNGSVLSFKTLADVMVIANNVATPAATTCAVSVDFTPNTLESKATIKLQYKRAVDPGYTDAATYSNLGGQSPLNKAWNLSGLTAGTLYDYRFVATRNAQNSNSLTSSVFQFTTAVTAQTTTGSETATPTDSVTVESNGVFKTESKHIQVGFGEQVSLELRSTAGEKMTGVWFYHFPTQSYWFWTLEGFSAALTAPDGRGENKTFLALGADIFLVDDESYPFDDKNQNLPIDTRGEFEVPLSLTPKTVDFKGRYAVPVALEVKMGADSPVDPTGTAQLEVHADFYRGGPLTRRLLGSRTVDMTRESAGVDEWRKYSLGRVRPTNVVGVRLAFPRGEHPKRKNRIVINGIRLVSYLTSLIRGRR